MASPPAPSPENVLSNPPAVFETARLRLRPWRDTDAPGPGEGPDDDSLRFMPAGAQPGPDDFPQWLARRRRDMETGSDLHWCIAEAPDAGTPGPASSSEPSEPSEPSETSGTSETSETSETSGTSGTSRTSDTMLGNVQIFRMGPLKDRFQGELGYWLRPGARGRGILGEALKPVIAHAFTAVEKGGLGLLRLHAATDGENHVSKSILRSAGFTQCGADHQAWRRSDGSLSDGAYFELLASDLTNHPAAALEAITLEGQGIRLRKWRHTDAERVAEAGSDARTQYWAAGILPSTYTLEDAHSYIAKLGEQASQGQVLCWCVADVEDDGCLGAVAVHHLRDALGTSGEIGYWTHPDARGRSVMSQAVRLAVRHAFIPREDGGLGRHRLQLNTADGNLASQHVALANGFTLVGRDRLAEPLGDGTFADLLRFDLLAAEWESAD